MPAFAKAPCAGFANLLNGLLSSFYNKKMACAIPSSGKGEVGVSTPCNHTNHFDT